MGLESEPDKTLFELATEQDGSARKWEALHILETRRLKPMVDAAIETAVTAKESAVAAKRSALASLIMTFIALASLCLNFYLIFFKAK